MIDFGYSKIWIPRGFWLSGLTGMRVMETVPRFCFVTDSVFLVSSKAWDSDLRATNEINENGFDHQELDSFGILLIKRICY